MNKIKIILALLIGSSSAYLLRDLHLGLNWVILFLVLILSHFTLVRSVHFRGNWLKLSLLLTAMLGVLLYGKEWSVFLLSITYATYVSSSSISLSHYLTELVHGVSTSFSGMGLFFVNSNNESSSKSSLHTRMMYVLIPLVIVLLFAAFYSTGSSFLSSFIGEFFDTIGKWMDSLFGLVDFQWFFLFMVGVWFLNMGIHPSEMRGWVNHIRNLPNALLRKNSLHLRHNKSKTKLFHVGMNSLKIEYKLGFIVLLLLNVLLLLTNSLDAWNLWLNFDPDTVNLSEFVHEGTYVLIFSIVLASLLLLFYFRGNINFLQGNENLLMLAKLWVLQNVILAISVGVRNYHYIRETHALTEKRIGVFIFLILVLVGLGSLYIKVQKRKSISWVVKMNFGIMIIILSFTQLVNWERVIIAYNFSNPEVESIDLEPLFRDVDYDLVYLDRKIRETKGRLVYKRYRIEEDAYETWNRIKYEYFKLHEGTEYKAWNYHKGKNLNQLGYYEVNSLKREVYR